MNRIFLVSTAVVGIAVVAGLVIGHRAETNDASVGALIARVATASDASGEDAVPTSAPAAHPSAAPAADHDLARYARIAEGMSTHDTFAFANALRKSKDRGAFAVVTEIQDACRQGMGALSRYLQPRDPSSVNKDLIRTAGSLEQGQAIQARYAQMMETRCRDASRDLALEEPIDGDESGAKVRLAQRGWYDRKTQLNAFYDMAEQGQLVTAHQALTTWPFFEGKRYANGEDWRMLIAAIEVAAYRATSDGTRTDTDLRLMAHCLDFGLCDGKIESYWFASWPEGSEKRLQAMALADRVTSAFERNDLRAFLPKLPPHIKLPDTFARF